VLVSLPLAAATTIEDGVASRFNLEIISRAPLTLIGRRIVRLRIPDRRSVPQVLAALRQTTDVTAPQPNFVYYKQGDGAAKPSFPMQYALDKLGALDAHDLAKGTGAVIAVIDSGIDKTHGDLKGRVIADLDTVAADARKPRDPKDELSDSHGTGVAGVIAADGVTRGIAPAAKLLNARAFVRRKGKSKTTALSTTFRVLSSLDWSIGEGARVLNMSFVGPKDGFVAEAVKAAQAKRAILVAAAGNNGPKAKPAYPAAYPGVLAVTATDAGDALYTKANNGGYVAFAAPGVDVFVPSLKNAFRVESGTSFAAAYVSGILALMLERQPDLTGAEARAVLEETALDLGKPGHDPLYGAGRVSAAKALAELDAIRKRVATLSSGD
ncbi:MAG: S8 family serine peptidase, partial [Pseudomonadota bacterium]